MAELKPVHARYLRLEIIKPGKTVPVQLAELRFFAPLAGAGGQWAYRTILVNLRLRLEDEYLIIRSIC